MNFNSHLRLHSSQKHGLWTRRFEEFLGTYETYWYQWILTPFNRKKTGVHSFKITIQEISLKLLYSLSACDNFKPKLQLDVTLLHVKMTLFKGY
jgi:hypothetical protein